MSLQASDFENSGLTGTNSISLPRNTDLVLGISNCLLLKSSQVCGLGEVVVPGSAVLGSQERDSAIRLIQSCSRIVKMDGKAEQNQEIVFRGSRPWNPVGRNQGGTVREEGQAYSFFHCSPTPTHQSGHKKGSKSLGGGFDLSLNAG